MRESKDRPHMNVGTIGHIDSGKTSLTAAILKVLERESWHCDRCQVEVGRLTCPHCGKRHDEPR